MIDTHCHIDTEQFDNDREEVLNRAFDAGVKSIIVPAIEPKDYSNLLNFTNSHNHIFCGMGVHPHNSDQYNEEIAKQIILHAKNNTKVVAIGEIGLDYFYDFVPKEQQLYAFREQLKIAKELNLPAIVHNRESEDDILRIIGEEQDGTLKGVIHCFSSPLDIMEQVLELGFDVSFTGNVTFKKSTQREVIEKVPMDRFMLETDSPYMAPVPKRGKRNEPSNLILIAEKIAEIKSISINEVIKMTTENAKKLFRLSAILLLMFSLFSINAFAQTDEEDDAYYQQLEHPYPKTFGIGPVFGSNTLVTTYRNDKDKVSDDVLVGYGVSADYLLLDYLLLDATYLYTKNSNNVIEVEKNGNIYSNKPNYDHLVELTSNWIFNPYSRVNFYAIAGLSFLYTDISQLKYTNDNIFIDENSTTNIGIASGIGLIINIPAGSAGLFAFTAEWRLDFMLNDVTLENDPREFREADDPNSLYYRSVDVGKFYSIPRIILKWYPKL